VAESGRGLNFTKRIFDVFFECSNFPRGAHNHQNIANTRAAVEFLKHKMQLFADLFIDDAYQY